jgi:hypothetical protein
MTDKNIDRRTRQGGGRCARQEIKSEGHADQAKGSLKKAVDKVADTLAGHKRSNERA